MSARQSLRIAILYNSLEVNCSFSFFKLLSMCSKTVTKLVTEFSFSPHCQHNQNNCNISCCSIRNSIHSLAGYLNLIADTITNTTIFYYKTSFLLTTSVK